MVSIGRAASQSLRYLLCLLYLPYLVYLLFLLYSPYCLTLHTILTLLALQCLLYLIYLEASDGSCPPAVRQFADVSMAALRECAAARLEAPPSCGWHM